jgi:LmbE family N-acetylglucosaminyl deacetylase
MSLVLGVFAHPDDESMGPGATFAKCAAAGHRVKFLTTTAGGAGRLFEERPTDAEGREELMRIRRRETVEAARILGAEHLGFLEWEDGRLRDRDILEIEETFAAVIRRERPDVVVTFHGSGISYHPDHRVVTLALTGAFLGAAREDWYTSPELKGLAPHAARRLYGFAPFGREGPDVEWPRAIYPPAPEEITTEIDTSAFADTKWAAIEAHASQQYGPPFRKLYEAGHFARETFVRIFPAPHAGEPRETDLFGRP